MKIYGIDTIWISATATPATLLDEQRLLHDLLTNYDRNVRPIKSLDDYRGGIEQTEVSLLFKISLLGGIVRLL